MAADNQTTPLSLEPIQDSSLGMHDIASAATSNDESLITSQIAPSNQSPLNGTDQLIDVTVSLVGILLLIYGLAWLLKRQKSINPSGKLNMKTLAVLPMGVKEKIVLVQVGPKQLLLGMTPQNINTLAQFDEPIFEEEAQSPSFANRLKTMMEMNRTQSSPQDIQPNHAEVSSSHQEQQKYD